MARLAEVLGKPLMPWQAYVVDVALEVLPDRRWAYPLVAIGVPRQSGKTTLFGGVVEQRALSTRGARCWFTAQTGKHAVDWLLNEHAPFLKPLELGYRLRRGAGFEMIRWHASGGMVRPFPPQPDALHGKTTDLVVVDECWAFDPVRGSALDQAIVPTQATKGGRAQVWKLSTAGDASSIWWQASVEAGRAAASVGKTEGVAYFEWSCPDDLDPCAAGSWPRFHPAYGRTIDDAAMAAALAQLGPDEFARAYGNRWVSTAARVIPRAAWLSAADDRQPLPRAGDLALGFDVAVDRSDAAIVAAWCDGPVVRLEVTDWREGTGWVAERLGELVGRWAPREVAYDAAGPALDVADAATRSGMTLAPLKARDFAAACAGLLEAVIAEPAQLRYRPHQALDDAAAAATRRALGDAWAWGRRQSSTSLSALTAATCARWAALHSQPSGPFRIF